jgi:putative MATE family efflux protein
MIGLMLDKPSQNMLISGSISRGLLSFFFPILFGTFFQQLYNTVDAIVVGQFVGKQALAAVGGGTGTFVNLLVGLFTGIASGASVLVSQNYGSKDRQDLQSSIRTGMSLCLIGSVIVTVIGLAISRWALVAISTPADILDYSLSYLRIYFSGIIFMFIYNMGSGILRSIGDSRTPMFVLIIGCFANIVLDLLFVVTFKLGVDGAAWATVISQAICAGIVLYVMAHSKEDSAIFRMKNLSMDSRTLKRMLYLGIPAGIQSCMYGLSNIIIQSGINSLGTDTAAANAAYGRIDVIFWMGVNSFGVAMTVFAGQNYGSGNFSRLKKGTWIGLALALAWTALCSVAFLLFGRQIMTLFTSDENVLDIGVQILWTIAPFFLTWISIEILSGTIRGCGQSLVPTLFTAFGICLVRVLWMAFAFPAFPSIITIMISYPLTWTLTSSLFWIYFRWGKWLRLDGKPLKLWSRL